jgi:hypothetical protein
MKKPIVVNLFAGPGAGKSTAAAYIFSQLKMKGVNCELITEFAKDKTWEKNYSALKCQEYVFGKQSYKMDRCRDQVDVIITDSPLPLGIFYNQNPVLGRHYESLVMDVFNTYDNLNFFINRTKPYNPVGRNQTEEEAKEIDNRIKIFCQEHDISYLVKDGTECGYIDIVDITLRYIEENVKIEELEESFALEYSD